MLQLSFKMLLCVHIIKFSFGNLAKTLTFTGAELAQLDVKESSASEFDGW